MDLHLLSSLIDPAILLFFFGLFAGAIRSNLEIPPALAKFFSLYLLLVVGFKGGVSLAATGFTPAMGWALLAATLLALAVPAWSFLVLKRRLSPFDAAAIAATYGSVSAVTFITAAAYAEQQNLAVGGYMAVALVLMESPAIIMAVLLANLARRRASVGAAAVMPAAAASPLSIGKVLHEAFTDGAHLLLLGGLAVGFITGDAGKHVMQPFTDLQKGVLAFFLLDMGLLVASRLKDLRSNGAFLGGFSILMPLFNAAAAAGLAKALVLPAGDAFMLMVLAASSSYIVVPAVVRYAIPEANPSIYFSMSLAMTFPFNIVLGIPLYHGVVQWLWT
ncbi:MAG: sodium-dependent bicarbonate transport family permease [Steroidobacteraceae bacterium]